jgi:hypothetical protein
MDNGQQKIQLKITEHFKKKKILTDEFDSLSEIKKEIDENLALPMLNQNWKQH